MSEDVRTRWQVKERVGDYVVSTIKLPWDHSFGNGTPLWYETMVFKHNGPYELGIISRDLECKRYSTQERATKGHTQIVRQWREK